MNTKTNQSTRVPVVDPNGKPLMPTTPARARKWIQHGKAVGKRNKLGVFYVQLTQKPSGYKTQPIVAGTDRGKCFTLVCISEQASNDCIVPRLLTRVLQIQELG